jgi:hypothetical protein
LKQDKSTTLPDTPPISVSPFYPIVEDGLDRMFDVVYHSEEIAAVEHPFFRQETFHYKAFIGFWVLFMAVDH